MRRETVISKLQKGNILNSRFSLGPVDFLWLADCESEVGCFQGCKSDLLGHQISGGHLSASPSSTSPFEVSTEHSQRAHSVSEPSSPNGRLLGFQKHLEKVGLVPAQSKFSSLSLGQIHPLLNKAGLTVTKIPFQRGVSPLSWFHYLLMYDLRQVTLSLGQGCLLEMSVMMKRFYTCSV